MLTYEIIARLIMAVIIGGVIGYERQHKNRPAGFRTHILVCLGATVVALIQCFNVNDALRMIQADPVMANVVKVDMQRLGAQVISGIGFLGAGTIIHEKGSIKGLTTAASLWVVGCIGLGIGMGYYFLAAASTITAVLVLGILKKFEKKYMITYNELTLQIEHLNDKVVYHDISQFFNNKNIKILRVDFSINEEDENERYTESEYTIRLNKGLSPSRLIEDLVAADVGVKRIVRCEAI